MWVSGFCFPRSVLTTLTTGTYTSIQEPDPRILEHTIYAKDYKLCLVGIKSKALAKRYTSITLILYLYIDSIS